jgi:hypothetical protein
MLLNLIFQFIYHGVLWAHVLTSRSNVASVITGVIAIVAELLLLFL